METRLAFAALLLSFVAVPGAAEVSVTPVGQRFSVRAVAAPLSEVLDQLARTTGMKVIYEGAPPRLPVTLTLEARTPVEAVLAVMEGQGLNFGLRADPDGQRVDSLVIAGLTQPGARPAQSPPTPPPGYPVVGPGPGFNGRDASEGLPGFDEEGEPAEPPDVVTARPRGQPTPVQPTSQALPVPSYPNSPFAPQPQVAPQAPPPPPEPEEEKKDE